MSAAWRNGVVLVPAKWRYLVLFVALWLVPVVVVIGLYRGFTFWGAIGAGWGDLGTLIWYTFLWPGVLVAGVAAFAVWRLADRSVRGAAELDCTLEKEPDAV